MAIFYCTQLSWIVSFCLPPVQKCCSLLSVQPFLAPWFPRLFLLRLTPLQAVKTALKRTCGLAQLLLLIQRTAAVSRTSLVWSCWPISGTCILVHSMTTPSMAHGRINAVRLPHIFHTKKKWSYSLITDFFCSLFHLVDGSWEQFCDPAREYSNVTAILQDLGEYQLLQEMNIVWPNSEGSTDSFWSHGKWLRSVRNRL